MVKSPMPWTKAPSIYKHIQTRLQALLLLFFPAQGQTVMTSTRAFNPSHLTQIPLFISKPLSLLLGRVFAQFLCSHINVAAFPWQVKQFTNTCKQTFHKHRTGIFWWSNRKKKKINGKILISSQAGQHWMSWTCWYIKGQVDQKDWRWNI